MGCFRSLEDAIADCVHDRDSVALEGFTHLIPFAAGHEIIRQRRKELTLIRMTPDLIYDQLIGAGCARKLVFSWGGNPGVGSLHRFRDAVEHGWPTPLELDEHSHAAMASAYDAGAANLPFAVLRAYQAATQLADVNPRIRTIICAFTGEALAAVPAIRPDVTIIHAQKSDYDGNVLIEGIIGVQKQAVLAASRAVVTVEEVVPVLDAHPNACVLPHWTVTAVAVVPEGARPSYAHGYYSRDNAFYLEWDRISRDRHEFVAWLNHHVIGRRSHSVAFDRNATIPS